MGSRAIVLLICRTSVAGFTRTSQLLSSLYPEACEKQGVELWVLDRPNPAGRPIDGTFLQKGNESFVGCAPLPTRHGLTIGELSVCFAVQTTAMFRESREMLEYIRPNRPRAWMANSEPAVG